MKKRKVIYLFLLILLIASLSIPVSAEPVLLQGVNEQDRFLVPMRSIFENLGANVHWDATTRTVTGTKGDTQVKLTIDEKDAYINGALNVLDVPAMIFEQRTFVPLRFVGESLGAYVGWDPVTRSATITLGDIIIKVYEELPEVPEVITTDNISYSVTPRVVSNGGNQTIYFEAFVIDDEGLPIADEYVSIFISSGAEDRSDLVVYDSNITDKDGFISASYTTSIIDNDKLFNVRFTTAINENYIEVDTNFLVTNTPTTHISGTVYSPFDGKPLAGEKVIVSQRDPHLYLELAVADANGNYDGYLPISSSPYYIGINLDTSINVDHTYVGSHSWISKNKFSYEYQYTLNTPNEVVKIDLDAGMIKGKYTNPRSDSQVIVFKIMNGKPQDGQGYAVPVASDGSYILAVAPGDYEVLDMRSAKSIRDKITVKTGEVLDLGSFTR